jgi:hypothetical protein
VVEREGEVVVGVVAFEVEGAFDGERCLVEDLAVFVRAEPQELGWADLVIGIENRRGG